MVNLCIAIGLERKKTSLKSLCLVSYHHLKVFQTPSKYRLCAISRAVGIIKNYRGLSKKHRVSTPYCLRPSLTICYNLKIRNDELHLPGGFHIPLNSHTLDVLKQPSIRLRSATLTVSKVCISFSKETPTMKCQGMLDIDRNLNNITVADSLGNIFVNDLSKVTMIKSVSRQTIAKFKRNDNRIRRQIASKYGRIQSNRTQWLLHNASKKLVEHAKTNRLNMVMENIRHIRSLYRKGNGQGHYYRGRLNSWSFYQIQRQISYKASWEGLSVAYVSPRGTTSNCSICGDHIAFSKESSRMLCCSSCGNSIDRDVNAARNILHKAAGLRFSLRGLSSEAVKGKLSAMVIPGVDGSQSSPKTQFEGSRT
jgi:putative transposase